MSSDQNNESHPRTYPPQAPPEPVGYAVPVAGQPMRGHYPMQGYRQTEPMAIVALALAVLGPATCGTSSLAGAILGHVALRKVRQNPEHLDGEGLAKAGMIIGWVMFGLFVLLILAYIAVMVFVITQGVKHGHR